jgi:hypothetical protein
MKNAKPGDWVIVALFILALCAFLFGMGLLIFDVR